MSSPRIYTIAPTLLAIATAGAAEPSVQANNGETLVITATRLEADPFEQPYALHQIGAEEVKQTNVRTLIDAVDRAPGVFIQRTAGNQASPYIRGLTGQQTLILFDGIRLNNALFRSGPNQYAAMLPDDAIDRVDVILGTGTTVLGSDGLTGAIDFRLTEAGRSQTKAISPWAKGRYGSAENGGGGTIGTDGRIGDWAYSLAGSLASFGELQGGSRAGDRLFGRSAHQDGIPHTDYEQYNVNGSLAYLGFAHQRLELSAGHVEQSSAERPDGYYENSNVPSALSRYYDPQVFNYVHLRHTSEKIGPWDRTRTTLWLHQHTEDQFREDIQNYGTATQRYRMRQNEDAVTTIGGDLQLTNVLKQHEVTYGSTIYQDSLSSEYSSLRSPDGNINAGSAVAYQNGTTNPELTTVPDGSTFTGIAVFAQDFWRITEQWSLLAGARYDHVAWDLPTVTTRAGYESFGNNDLEGNAEALTGNLRLAYQINDPWMTWAGVGQGFRTPTASDLAGTLDRASSSSGPGSGPQTKANPDLKPERSITFEWGTRFKRDENTASFTVFRTELQDLITTRYIDVNGDGVISNLPPATNPDSAIRDNASRAYLQGGEVASDLGLPVYNTWRLSVFQTTSLVEGKARIPQPSGSAWQYISRANTLNGKIGLKLADKGQWYGLTQVRWADGYDKAAPSDANDVRMTVAGNTAGQMAGWAVIDVKGGISDPKNAWRIDAGIENLGNITYRQVGSGADGAGLNFVLSAEVRF